MHKKKKMNKKLVLVFPKLAKGGEHWNTSHTCPSFCECNIDTISIHTR